MEPGYTKVIARSGHRSHCPRYNYGTILTACCLRSFSVNRSLDMTPNVRCAVYNTYKSSCNQNKKIAQVIRIDITQEVVRDNLLNSMKQKKVKFDARCGTIIRRGALSDILCVVSNKWEFHRDIIKASLSLSSNANQRTDSQNEHRIIVTVGVRYQMQEHFPFHSNIFKHNLSYLPRHTFWSWRKNSWVTSSRFITIAKRTV